MIPSGVRIWVVAGMTDMRCGANGLSALVQKRIDADPLSGQIFIFRGRKGHIVKILWADPEGICCLYKRLHEGQFPWSRTSTGAIEVTAAQLSMLFEGMDWRRVRRPKDLNPDARPKRIV